MKLFNGFGSYWARPYVVKNSKKFIVAFVKPPTIYCPLCNYEMRPIHKTLGDHSNVECVTNNCSNKGKVFSIQLQTIQITEVQK